MNAFKKIAVQSMENYLNSNPLLSTWTPCRGAKAIWDQDGTIKVTVPEPLNRAARRSLKQTTFDIKFCSTKFEKYSPVYYSNDTMGEGAFFSLAEGLRNAVIATFFTPGSNYWENTRKAGAFLAWTKPGERQCIVIYGVAREAVEKAAGHLPLTVTITYDVKPHSLAKRLLFCCLRVEAAAECWEWQVNRLYHGERDFGTQAALFRFAATLIAPVTDLFIKLTGYEGYDREAGF